MPTAFFGANRANKATSQQTPEDTTVKPSLGLSRFKLKPGRMMPPVIARCRQGIGLAVGYFINREQRLARARAANQKQKSDSTVVLSKTENVSNRLKNDAFHRRPTCDPQRALLLPVDRMTSRPTQRRADGK